MEKYLSKLQQSDFLQTKEINNENLFHITTPCVFRLEADMVQSLKKNYKSDEEIGGVLSAMPTMNNNEKVYLISKVCYVRNAIEDNPRKDGKNKSNAYLPDLTQLNNELSNIIKQGCLPIKFHTHPTDGYEYFQTIINQNYQTDTSDQDKRESESPINIAGQKLLMPRCLIVGNAISTSDIFIGVYGGFVAPVSFDTSKRKIMDENIKKTADYFSNLNLSNGQKIGLGIGAALLVFSLIKYPKYSLPVLFGLAATAPILLTNTQNIDRPEYFNRLTFGNADIYIPKND